MSLLLALALLVVDPSLVSHRDVAVLPFLCPAAEQDDNSIPVFAKVHAIPRSVVEAIDGDAPELSADEEAGIEAALESYRQGRVVDAKRARQIIDAALGR